MRLLFTGKFKIVLSCFVFLLSSNLWSFDINITPEEPKQGDVILIRIGHYDGETPEGSFLGKKLHFFKSVSGDFLSLAGIDMKTTPGEYNLTLNIDEKITEKKINVVSGLFEIQRLTLPQKMVDLDHKTLKRVEAELTRLAKLWPIMNEKLWESRFIMPLQGAVIGSFGAKRIINHQEKSPHSGIDIRAKEGDPIIAPNNGRIVLIDEQFFGGKTIVIDHGYGIYSMFYHLSKIEVHLNQKVKRGDLIGLAGSTGRATGPHLHWGVRLHGQRINPLSLVELNL